MLLWAKTDEHLIVELSTVFRLMSAPLKPPVLYLRIDPEVALRRAVAERGSVWFERHAVDEVTASNPEERVLALADLYSQRDHFRRHVLEDGKWNPFYIDGSGKRQEVLRTALTALGLKP